MILQVTINYNIYNPGSLPIVGTFPGLVSDQGGSHLFFYVQSSRLRYPKWSYWVIMFGRLRPHNVKIGASNWQNPNEPPQVQ